MKMKPMNKKNVKKNAIYPTYKVIYLSYIVAQSVNS